jgi:hypothetical protein
MTEEEKNRIDEHFIQYRRLCDRAHFTNVQDALNFWADWQETTARLLMHNSENREYAKQKLADAKQRRAETAKIAERAKK